MANEHHPPPVEPVPQYTVVAQPIGGPMPPPGPYPAPYPSYPAYPYPPPPGYAAAPYPAPMYPPPYAAYPPQQSYREVEIVTAEVKEGYQTTRCLNQHCGHKIVHKTSDSSIKCDKCGNVMTEYKECDCRIM
eukprot:gnl/Hemi2/4157_TR1441_c0_g1_i1.p1 gnl/Hemi2/4157_TR1441_c0_g1~~gnl/Hemi2/4157_TR1441_c0_g1_i1.p1  ORF type:complete len:132 (+),score=24.75 gnl/Hemi2/4157_TR1441_c0_g1_i1:85-480(+)